MQARISPIRPPAVEILEDKVFLVTGFTGFLGKVWVASMLEHVPSARFVLAIRAGKSESGTDRATKAFKTYPIFRALREKWGGDFERIIEQRVTVIESDVQTQHLGLGLQNAQRLMRGIDAVINFAGVTDFSPDPKTAYEANVLGPVNMAELALMTRRKLLIHVSTAFVAGNQDGAVSENITVGMSPTGVLFVPEQELDFLRLAATRTDGKKDCPTKKAVTDRAKALGWPNTYTYSKALAEHLLLGQSDLQLSVVRPSIVECAARGPLIGWNEGINTCVPIVWLIKSPLPTLPLKGSNILDVVPVDDVSNGVTICLLERLTNTQAPVFYHASTGDHNPITFARTVDIIEAFYKPTTPTWRSLLGTLPGNKPFDQDPLLNGLSLLTKGPLGQVADLGRMSRRVNALLASYHPFVWANNYRFDTTNMRTLANKWTDRLPAAMRFGTANIDWFNYWTRVQLPGLEKWSLPILRGQKVDYDVASSRRLRLESPKFAVPRERDAEALEVR